jgi:aminoglycoside 3-N-acetyltransferase
MLTYRDLCGEFRRLDLPPTAPVLVHALPASFDGFKGGVDTLLGGLLSSFSTVLMPAFTFRTMLIPETGPEDNALAYGSGRETNPAAEFFRPNLPVDPGLGLLPERLRQVPQASRSSHPILSFSGVNAADFLAAQTLEDPLALIGALAQSDGWVLLVGVDQTVNVSLHWAERLAGRRQFLRWALTPGRILECPRFPGCPDGFPVLEPHLEDIRRPGRLGPFLLRAYPLADLLEITSHLLHQDPADLLCSRSDCERCAAVRRSIYSLS